MDIHVNISSIPIFNLFFLGYLLIYIKHLFFFHIAASRTVSDIATN